MRTRSGLPKIARVLEMIVAFLTVSACVNLMAGVRTNQLPNSGFEKGDGDTPMGWSFYSWEDAEGWWDRGVSHTGRSSLGLRGLNGGWSTTVPVSPGRPHSVRFYGRSQTLPSRAVLYIRVPVGPRKMDVILYKPIPTVAAGVRGRFVDGVYEGGADERGWVLYDAGDFVPPEGVQEVNLLIKIRSTDPEAKLWLDDLVVEALETRTIPDTGRVLARLDDAVVWTDDPNRKILPGQAPPGKASQDTIFLAPARGEFESFQIAVRPGRDWPATTWTWDTLSGPGSFPADGLRCRLVESVVIDKPMGPYGLRGVNPDPLTERLPMALQAGINQTFWFTLRVRRDQMPGEYSTRLRLLCSGAVEAKIPLRVRVRPFSLPVLSRLDTRSNVRLNLALARESGEPNEVMQRYYRNVYEHRSRCAPGVHVSLRLVGDAVSLDADRYLEHLRLMRDEYGAKRFDITSLWIGHRGTHRLTREAVWQRRPIFADDDLTTLNPDFERPFRAYMGRLVTKLREAGLFLSPSVRYFDEPNLGDPVTVNGLRTLAKLLLDIEPELTVAMTATHPHPALIDVAKRWILHTDAWDRHAVEIAAAREAGCSIYVYNNGVNFPEHRPVRVRLWPWLLAKYRVDGSYSWWGTVCWRNEMADPWTAGKGDSGVLLYPPRTPQEHGPIDSVRWELFREGLEDAEMMYLAETLSSELEEAGRADAARRGRAAVAACLDLVTRWPSVKGANDEPYTLDVTAVARARTELADAVEAMSIAAK